MGIEDHRRFRRRGSARVVGAVLALAGLLLASPISASGQTSDPPETSSSTTPEPDPSTEPPPTTAAPTTTAPPTTAPPATTPPATTPPSASTPDTTASTPQQDPASDGDGGPGDIILQQFPPAVVGIDKRVDGDAPFTPGEEFNYELVAQCSSLTTGCVDAVVTDVLPAEFEVTSLPPSSPLREVTYDEATRTLTIRFREGLLNPAGTFGMPAGQTRTVTVAMRVPQETPLADGTQVPNTADIAAVNAPPASDTVNVPVTIPRQVRPVTTKQWTDGSAIAQSHEASTITLGVRNGSTSSAQVSELTVTDDTADVFDRFDVTRVGPVTRFPAGADRVAPQVCTKPVGSPCTDAEWESGPAASAPAPANLQVPAGVDPGDVTGVRFVFTNSAGNVLPFDPTGGTVEVGLELRDTIRSTGAQQAPAVRQRVTNAASTSATDPVLGEVEGPEATAPYDVQPNVATVRPSKQFFSDGNGDFRADGEAVLGRNSPVSAIASAQNTSPFGVSTLTITEPSATAAHEFAKFDVSSLRVTFPQGATSATLTVTCRGGSVEVVTLTPPPTSQDRATGCPGGDFPSQMSITFRGTTATGDGAIVSNATASLGMRGNLNDLVDQSDTGTGNGVVNCIDVSTTNPIDGTGAGAGTACTTLRVAQPRVDPRGVKTSSHQEVAPGQPVDFTVRLDNSGNVPLVSPTVSDPAVVPTANNPFDIVRLLGVTTQTSPAGLPHVIEVFDPDADGGAGAWVPFVAGDVALLERAQGVRARVPGEMPVGARLTMTLQVQLRDDVDPEAGAVFQNCAGTFLADAPVGNPFCAAASEVAPAEAAGAIQKSIEPSTLPRPIPGLAEQDARVKLRVQNSGNINLDRIVVTDIDEDFFDAVTLDDDAPIFGVNFPLGANRVQVDVCTSPADCAAGTFVEGTPTSSQTPGLPAAVSPADVVGLRVTFTHSSLPFNIRPGTNFPTSGPCPDASVCFTVNPRQTLRSDPGTPVPDHHEDTASAEGESRLQTPGQTFDFGDSTATLDLVEGTAQIDVDKAPDSRIGPGDVAPFFLTVRNTGTGNLPDLVVVDPIPPELVFDETFQGPGGQPFVVDANVPEGTALPPAPTFTPTREGERVTSARWDFPGWQMAPGAEVRIQIQVRLAPGVPAGTLATNTFGASSATRTDVGCLLNQTDDRELVDDDRFGAGRFCTNDALVTTLAGSAFAARKWDAGNPDLGWWNTASQQFVPTGDASCPAISAEGQQYTSFPCAALINPGENFHYLLRMQNAGTDPATEMRVVDVFPAPGDTGVILTDQARETEWSTVPRLIGPPTLAGSGELATTYTTGPEVCTDDLDMRTRVACPADSWSDGFTSDAVGMQLFTRFPTPLPPAGIVDFLFDMSSPVDINQPTTPPPSIAWNSFAHAEVVTRAGREVVLPPTEPPKVGVGMLFGDLEVAKVIGENPAGIDFTDETFGVAFRCTVTPETGDPVVVREGAARVGLDMPLRLTGVPAAAVCEVWETDPLGGVSSVLGEANAAVMTITPNGFPGTPDPENPEQELPQAVNITNDFPLGRLQITKAVTGPAAEEFGTGPFVVSVDCTGPTGEDLDGFPQDLTFQGGGSQSVVLDVPIGSVCTADETETGGATTVTVEPADGVTITDPDAPVAGQITVINDFQTGGLRILKNLTGPGAEQFADGTFVFRVACSFNGVDDAFVGALSLRRDDPSQTTLEGEVVGIPAGALCTVSETENGGADETPAPVGPLEIPAGDVITTQFEFANNFSTGSLTLLKVVDGPGAQAPYAADATFDLQVACRRPTTDADGNPTVAMLLDAPVEIQGGQENQMEGEEIAPIAGALPVGAQCWAVEMGDGGATRSTIDFGSDDNAVTVEPPGDDGNVADITLTAVNTFQVGELQLTKEVSGDAAQYAEGLSFQLLLSCRLPGADPEMLFEDEPFEVTDGELTPVDVGFPLADGTECWATEATTGGATTATVDFGSPDNPVVVSEGEPVTITASNVFDAAPLMVVKEVVGDGSLGPYRFSAACTLGNIDGAERELALAAEDASFELMANESKTLSVPVGSECTVSEVDPPSGATVTVADSDPDSDGGTTDGVVRLNGDGQVVVTNTFPPGPPAPPAPPRPSPGAGGRLPFTGWDPWRVTIAGLVSLVAGVATLGWRHRRRPLVR